MPIRNESVLERVIREVNNSPHPSPFPIEQNPFFEGKWFNIGRRAVEILDEPSEIKDFMKKYILYISNNHGLSIKDAEISARNIVDYSSSYVDDERANIWFNALPDISHPITGRERPFKKEDNVSDYYILGITDNKEIISYLTKVINYELSFFRFQVLNKQQPIYDRDNQNYFAFRLKHSNNKFLEKSDPYLFLSGFIMGLKDRMKKELSKSCELNLETVKIKPK